ncbi:MAG: hypothetical protein IKC83_03030 [Clostridia bacterium]|nr:hypothetical protein [Clostridia bacterium]
MKKVLLTVMILILAVSLVGCGSSYGKIKSAFEKEGYAEQEIKAGDDYKKLEEEMKEDGIEFTVHHLQEDALIGKKNVIILEFKNIDGIKDVLEGDNDVADAMKGLLEALDTTYEEIYDELVEVGLVNGNCMFIISLADVVYLNETLEIFKNA